MTPTLTATAPLVPHVVWPQDPQCGRGCTKCRRRVEDLDTIVTDPKPPGGFIRHIQCLSAAERRTLETVPEAERCWYAANTPAACPFRIERHNLCKDHHGQLCRDGEKKRLSDITGGNR